MVLWEDFDPTADLDKDGRVTEFVLKHNHTAAEYYIGARMKGSSLDRRILIHESEFCGLSGFGITVQSDENGVVQIYHGIAPTNDYVFLVGYYIYG